VTDEEIEQEAVANADTDDEYRAFKYGAFFVQERIHRPDIQPVPVSDPPGPEDCDAEGRCWWGVPAGTVDPNDERVSAAGWALVGVMPDATHWLPHWALPVPEVR
jgi:hypothetical protein